MQGLALDWKRFVSDRHIDFLKFERDTVKEFAPGAKFTVNMMYRFDGIDYFKMSKEIDIASWDNYPTWHKPSETVEETALDTALMHDLYYSMKGRPFLPDGIQPQLYQLAADLQTEAPRHCGACGSADGCTWFGQCALLPVASQPRRGRKFHGAVVGHDGREDARPFRETVGVGQKLEVLSEIATVCREKQAAIVHDWENKWALEGSCGPRNAGMGYWDELKLHYNALAREGIAVEFVNQESDLTGYGLVVVPMVYLLTDAFAQNSVICPEWWYGRGYILDRCGG